MSVLLRSMNFLVGNQKKREKNCNDILEDNFRLSHTHTITLLVAIPGICDFYCRQPNELKIDWIGYEMVNFASVLMTAALQSID